MAKILYLCSTVTNEGPTIHLRTLLDTLNTEAFEAEVLTLSPEPRESLWEYFCNRDIPCHSLGLSKVKGLLFGIKDLTRFLEDGRFDIIHSSGIRADMLSAMAQCHIARVSTRHEPFYDYHIAYRGQLIGRLIEYFHCRALARMDCVVACSETVRRSAPRHLQPKVRVVRNCVDTSLFALPTPREKSTLRRELGLPLDQKVLVFVGRLVRVKDVETTIRGFLASNLDSSALLLIIGDGSERTRCEMAARKSPKVKFLGFCSKVPKYLQAADVYVSSSMLEGLPLSVIEALACGLPCVLSDIGPHRELASSLAGIELFPLGNWQQLARTMEQTMQIGAKYSKITAQLARQRFSSEIMASGFQEVYRSVLREE